MAAAGWSPTVDNYFGRVAKARILEAVREAKASHFWIMLWLIFRVSRSWNDLSGHGLPSAGLQTGAEPMRGAWADLALRGNQPRVKTVEEGPSQRP